jgi:DNA polymerase-3 subunit epsilon
MTTDATESASLNTYLSSFRRTWSDHAPVEGVRFVVLDCESTGLDPKRDRIVSIGAIAVVDAQILLGDVFETLLRVSHNTAATLVHGITRSEARFGIAEDAALLKLLPYLRDGVIVGHHIEHDLAMLNAACRRHFDMALGNRWIDTLGLTRQLERHGALDPGAAGAGGAALSLDALCERFGITPYDRHTAPGDAFLTAQIFLRLLRYARRCGRTTLQALAAP